jgi:hypothetical protein
MNELQNNFIPENFKELPTMVIYSSICQYEQSLDWARSDVSGCIFAGIDVRFLFI